MLNQSTPGGGTNGDITAGLALGYLAQVEYAPRAMLKRMDIEASFSVSTETLGYGPRGHVEQTPFFIGRPAPAPNARPLKAIEPRRATSRV